MEHLIRRIETFVAEHHRAPDVNAESAEEQLLAEWFQQALNGLNKRQRTLLLSAIPSTADDPRVDMLPGLNMRIAWQRLDEYVAWRQEHEGRHPTRTGDATERSIFNWLRRTIANTGQYPDEFIEKLEEVAPDWREATRRRSPPKDKSEGQRLKIQNRIAEALELHNPGFPESAVTELSQADTCLAQTNVLYRLRQSGWTLQQLADCIGVTRERARQLVMKYDADLDPNRDQVYPDAPSKAQARKRESERFINKQRVNGLRLRDPALQVPVAKLNRLMELQQLTTQVRGFTPLDDPARLAIPEYLEVLQEIIDGYGVSYYRLAALTGMSVGTFQAYLRSHGVRKQHPSQKSYRGLTIGGKRGVNTKLWDERFASFEAFVAEHGHLPISNSDDSHERKLAIWRMNQIGALSKGTGIAHDEDRLAKLRTIPNFFSNRAETRSRNTIRKNLSALLAWQREHGRWPRRTGAEASPEERRLATWWSNVKRSKNVHILREEMERIS